MANVNSVFFNGETVRRPGAMTSSVSDNDPVRNRESQQVVVPPQTLLNLTDVVGQLVIVDVNQSVGDTGTGG